MKLSHILALASAAHAALQIDYAGLSMPSQYYKGMNIRAAYPFTQNNTSGYKQYQDWDFAFSRLKNFTGSFNAVRIYSTQDVSTDKGSTINHLESVYPLVMKYDLKLLVGIYLDETPNYAGQNRFQTEFAVLKNATSQYKDQGILDHIIGITVGNEDQYRNWTTAAVIADEINQVKTWLEQDMGDYCIPVGHTDTWNALLQDTSQPIVNASDFLVANIFPFWEDVPIDMAKDQFARAVGNLSAITASSNVPIWLGETGWPKYAENTKPVLKNAIASVENMQKYWTNVACEVLSSMNAFFYIDEDVGQAPAFGIWANNTMVIDISCPGSVAATRSNYTGNLSRSSGQM